MGTMEILNEGTLIMLGFKKPSGRWLQPEIISVWLNENPIDRSWSIYEGSSMHFSGITRRSDLIVKYKLLTGVDLKFLQNE